jgi:hypothetical protein
MVLVSGKLIADDVVGGLAAHLCQPFIVLHLVMSSPVTDS